MTIDCLYVNGDSWAYGFGLEDDTRLEKHWPGIVAKHFNLELICDAYPGGSNHRIIRTTVRSVEELISHNRNPLVLLAWTRLSRYELNRLSDNQWQRFMGNGTDDDKKLGNLIAEKYNSDYGNLEMFITQLLMMQSYLKFNNIKHISVPTFRLEYDAMSREEATKLSKRVDMNLFLHDFAMRGYLNSFNDLEWIDDHPGEEGHALIAEFLIKQIERRKLV